MHSSQPTMSSYLAKIDSQPLKVKWNNFLNNLPEFTDIEIQFILLHTEIGKWWRGEAYIDGSTIKLSELIFIFEKHLISDAANKEVVTKALWDESDKLRAYYIYGLRENEALTEKQILSNFKTILASRHEEIIQDLCVKSPYLQNITGLENILSMRNSEEALLNYHLNYGKVVPSFLHENFYLIMLASIKNWLEKIGNEEGYKSKLLHALQFSTCGLLWQGGYIKVGNDKSYQWKNIDSSKYIKIFFNAIKLEHANINTAVTAEALWNTSVFLQRELKYGRWHKNPETQLVLFFMYILKTQSSLIINSIWQNNLLLREAVNELDLYRASKILRVVLSLSSQSDCRTFILDYMKVLKDNAQSIVLIKAKSKIISKMTKLNALMDKFTHADAILANLERSYAQLALELNLINEVIPDVKNFMNSIFFFKFEHQANTFLKSMRLNEISLDSEIMESEELGDQENPSMPIAMEEEDKCLYQTNFSPF